MTGSTRAVSTRGSTRVAPGLRRLTADVDDRRTGGGQGQAVFDGAVAVEEQASVGERVVGDVDDAHHLHARSVSHLRRMRSNASDRDALSVLNCPRTADVVVVAPGLRMPRIAMQRCSASIDDDDAARIELAHDRVGDLTGEPLLDLRPLGVQVDHPGELRETR